MSEPTPTGAAKPFFARLPAALQIGLILGVSIAAFDVSAVVLFEKPNGMRSLLAVALHAAGSMAAVWVIYFGAWLLIAGPAILLLRRPAFAASIGVAGLITPMLILRAIGVPVLTVSLFGNPYRTVLWLALSAAVGIFAYMTTRLLEAHPRKQEWSYSISLALPLVTTELLLLCWLRMYKMSGGLSLFTAGAYVAALVVMALTVALMATQSGRRHGHLGTIGVAVFILIVLAGYRSWTEPDVRKHASTFSEPHKIPRIILITVDTLRRDVLKTYSPESDIGENIDTLARDSVRFERAYTSGPWTTPSVASIMTGLSPEVHGVNRGGRPFPQLSPTIADVLLEEGYVTAGFGANGLLSHQSVLERGFQEYQFPLGVPGRSLGSEALTMIVGRDVMVGQQMTESITAMAERWVQANQEQDFFLWMHYMDPHEPYVPPREFVLNPERAPSNALGRNFSRWNLRSGKTMFNERQKEWARELYRSEVRYVDDRIGRLLGTIKSLGLYDDALIIFTTDHGEEFWDHENVDHGHSLYNELISTPLFVKLPSSMTPQRTTVRAGVPNASVMPTVLDLCDIAFEPEQFSTESLVPLWTSPDEPEDNRSAFSSKLVYYDERVSVVHQGWKYIQFVDRPKEELYNLNEDPEERVNLATLSTERRDELRVILKTHQEQSAELAQRYRVGQFMSHEERETVRQELKSLGYIQ